MAGALSMNLHTQSRALGRLVVPPSASPPLPSTEVFMVPALCNAPERG